MSGSRFLTVPGFLPRAIALLLAFAVLGFPPVSVVGAAVASDDDQHPDSQPCEESPDESLEDEESSAGKHASVLGCPFLLDPPSLTGDGIESLASRLPAGLLAASTPIRGPPASA